MWAPPCCEKYVNCWQDEILYIYILTATVSDSDEQRNWKQAAVTSYAEAMLRLPATIE